MTILLYDEFELEERASKHFKSWKACHLMTYTLAAVFGLVNFVFFQNTMALVDEHCVLFPKTLEFRMVELPVALDSDAHDTTNLTETAQDFDVPSNDTAESAKVKRDALASEGAILKTELNMTAIAGNTTHRLMLDTSRTLFESDNTCQFAEFMPILSTIFAAVWLTLFTMCPGGGHARAGLVRPWRILAPALVFTLVMVGLTGYSFTTTNKGLHAFCEAFSEVTNSTTCSSVNEYLELGWNATWSFSSRAASTRACAAGVWAAWACAGALLLARCLAGADFAVRRTAVYLTRDPQQKIIPHLKSKSPRSHRSSGSSPTKRDTASMRSEPTATTELVSASVEPGPDSAPSSLMTTPIKMTRNADVIEMTYNPQERILERNK